MYADNGGTWPSLSQVFAAVAVAAATVAVVARRYADIPALEVPV